MFEILVIVILAVLLVYGALIIIDQRKIIESLKNGLKIVVTAKMLEEFIKSVEEPQGEKK